MRVSDEFSVDLQVGAVLLLCGVLLEGQLEGPAALVDFLPVSAGGLLEAQGPHSAEGKELQLAVGVRLLRKLSLGQMFLDLGVLPDIDDAAHETVDVQGQKVLIALDGLKAGVSRLKDHLIEIFNASAVPNFEAFSSFADGVPESGGEFADVFGLREALDEAHRAVDC